MRTKFLIFVTGLSFLTPSWAGRVWGFSDVTVTPWHEGPRDKPAGSGWVINKKYATFDYEDIDCPIYVTATVEGGELVPGYTDMYKTQNPTVGLKFGLTVNPGDHTSNFKYKYTPFTEKVNISGSGSFTLGRGISIFALTGYAEPGVLNPIAEPRMKYTYSGSCIDTVTRYVYVTPDVVNFTPVTCSVANKNILVDLGTYPRDQFQAVGQTTPEVDFNIDIDCDKTYDFNTIISVTFTDDSDRSAGNNTDILPLDAQSTAKGLGVQILYKDSPISFGPDSSFAGTENQIELDKMEELPVSSYTYNFKARYISTGPVSAGTANTRATFTMSYQ